MPTRLQIARREILTAFEEHPSKVLRSRDIARILASHRKTWRLADSTTLSEFADYLRKSGSLKRFEFAFPHRKETRFVWGNVPLQAVLLSLHPKAHFSHYTAVQMHDLTEQDPKTVYLNIEQPPKPAPAGELLQDRIDAAFKRRPRLTNNVARFGAVRVCLLNGKHTAYLGIETRAAALGAGAEPTPVRVTDMERTLIDIAVRPFYAGGVGEVVKAYQRAGDRASVNRLAALLKSLAYVYPYHQAVGFYLERSGVHKSEAIELFRSKFEFRFRFYLTYEMKETRYDPRWQLYVPQGF